MTGSIVLNAIKTGFVYILNDILVIVVWKQLICQQFCQRSGIGATRETEKAFLRNSIESKNENHWCVKIFMFFD